MAALLNLFHLVKFQKARSGAEDIITALPLINSLSICQDLFAVGAGPSQIRVGECRRWRLGVSRQGEN